MCGISGIYTKTAVDCHLMADSAVRIRKALYNRGPDDNGIVMFAHDSAVSELKKDESPYSPFIKKTVDACLIHTRLSIIDLSDAGHQPMHTEDGRYWITFNGEIYNYLEIRDKLRQCGCEFFSKSDTEVILKGWVQFGNGILGMLNGMFSFAIYDAKEHSFFIARDRIGIKPLYYHLTDKLFLFASDITSIIASGLYHPEISWEGISSGIRFRGALRPCTAYENVFALKPGHYLEVDRNLTHKTVKYWDLPTDGILEISEDEAFEEYESLLKKAIRRCLVSDVEIASLMSGGLDSTTMSAVASGFHPDIKAFTLIYDKSQPQENELDEARENARKNSIRHIVTRVTEEEVLKNFDTNLFLFEEPIGMLEPHLPIARHIHDNGIKVVLNGLGPDELLGGYYYYRYVSDFWNNLRKFNKIFSKLPDLWKLRTFKAIACADNNYDLYNNLFSTYLFDNTDIFADAGINGTFNSNELSNLLDIRDKIHDSYQQFSYCDIKVYIGTHHNHTTDKFLMHHSVEGRFPYLDHELVEFSFRLPHFFKCRNKVTKYILRKIAGKYIPDSCISMNKKGFGIPEKEIIGTLRHILEDRITALKKRSIFRNAILNNAISDLNRDTTSARRALYFANFELWIQWFIEKKHPYLSQ